MRLKKMSILLVLPAVVLLLISCGAEALPATEEIVSAMQDAQNNLETNRTETTFDATIDMSIPGTEPFEMSMAFSGTMNMTMDLLNQETEMISQITMTPAEGKPGKMNMRIDEYIVDRTVYMKMYMPLLLNIDSPMFNGEWIKVEMPEWYDDYLTQMDVAQFDFDTLEWAQVDLLGSEKVNGTSCYVLNVVPDMKMMWGSIASIMQQSGMENFLGTNSEFSQFTGIIETMWGEIVEDFSFKQWIAQDTFFPMKSEMHVAALMDTEDLMTLAEQMEDGEPGEDIGEFSMRLDINMNMVYFDHNKPVSIDLPPEAANAVDISELQETQ